MLIIRNNKVLWAVLVLLLVGIAVWAWQYGGFGAKNLLPGQIVQLNPTPSGTASIPYRVETVAQNLEVPWSIVFTSPTRILVTERAGRVRVINNSVAQPQPLHTFTEVLTGSEEGLMGMDIHPNYAANKYVYFALSHRQEGNNVVKVVRMTDQGDRLTDAVTVFDTIPAANVHAGGRLKFGPDGKLYVTTGDATERNNAQDRTTLHGKILRLNDDGSIPNDNPFPDSPIYSYGHRNPQGLAWHPTHHTLWCTEHGPSIFDGPAGGDEVNLIMRGDNYGWPLVSHENSRPGLTSPLLVFTPAVAPASAMIYTSDYFPQFKHNLFFGGLRGEGLFRVVIDEQEPNKILSYEKMADISVGRVRDVVEGPEGAIYFSTSNRDGRGKPSSTDDTIYRLVTRD